MVHHLLPRIVQAQHLSGQGQGVPTVGIHDQEFFLNTKSTHILSVTDIWDKDYHESLPRGPTTVVTKGGSRVHQVVAGAWEGP